jgi:HAE1 family hydrophobic/amphiphilic exporter-1
LNVEPPVIRKNSTESDPILWLGLTGPQPLRELINYVDEFLVDQIQVVPGVGEVSLGGYSDRNLRIWVDSEKLRRYQLTILDVRQAIERQHVEVAAGYIENSTQEINVRTLGEGVTAQEVSDIVITHRGGQPIYDGAIKIGDVAQVEDGLNDIRRIARLNGNPGISIGIRKQRGANEVAVGHAVKKKIEEINQGLPDGMKLLVNVDFTRFVEDAVLQTEEELILAALATAIICFLFLGNWSSALNIILSIPTSIVGTFIIIYFMGFTLNTFTLLGLALAIGIVVDDAIMVLENIVRHFKMGKSRAKASLDGAVEITFAAVAATVAVIAIFLPVAFMEGIIGKYFFQFGITITAAVALSLLEALTLTPMRCSQFLHESEKPNFIQRTMDFLFNGLRGGYRRALSLSLRFRWLVVLVALVVFAWSLLTAGKLRQEFVPAQDQNFIRMPMRMPTGASLEFTDKKTLEVEEYVKKRPEVARYFASVGGLQGTPNQSFLAVTLVDKDKREKSQADVINEFRRDLGKIKDVRISYQDLSSRGLTARRSQPVEFNLRGPDLTKLDEASQEIMRRLDETGLVVDTDNSYRTGMPELRIYPDRDAASRRGVSMQTIGDTINTAIGGVRQGKFTRDGRRYDVRIRLIPEERLKEEDLARLDVRNTFGELVALTDVVKYEVVSTVQSITRVNRQRSISVTANLATGASQSEALKAAEQISREVLPSGYSFELEGGAQTFQESFRTLFFTFILGVVVAYMVLASQFNSFIHPVTILLALPFSITGATWSLFLFDQSLNLYSAIGLILLMGIVKKNSILLVEFTNQKRYGEHMDVHDALMTAAPIRLRPILMTSMATIAAALPLALGFGAGAESRRPMALAILGGVIVSTVFTLFVVPCAYSLFARLERRPPFDREIV